MSDSESTRILFHYQFIDENRKEPQVDETVIVSSSEESDASSPKEIQTEEIIDVAYRNGN